MTASARAGEQACFQRLDSVAPCTPACAGSHGTGLHLFMVLSGRLLSFFAGYFKIEEECEMYFFFNE